MPIKLFKDYILLITANDKIFDMLLIILIILIIVMNQSTTDTILIIELNKYYLCFLSKF